MTGWTGAAAIPGVPEQNATRAAFALAGCGMAAWAPLVPAARARLGVPGIGLDAGTLGLVLLCFGIGSLLTMPVAGTLTARLGCRRMICTGCTGMGLMLPALAVASSLPVLALSLLLFGAALGLVDVAMNVQAVLVEQASGRAMMSGFHAFFSIGGIVGASGLSLLLWLGATPLGGALCVSLAIGAALPVFAARLLPRARRISAREPGWFVLPHGRVLLIGCLTFIAFLTEGVMLDWSGVFLTSLRHVAVSAAGLGYAVFSVAMTLGRLAGDRVVQMLGGRAVVAGGALCAAGGLGLAVLVTSSGASFAGFAMVGLGSANIVPVLFTALGRQQAIPPGQAIAAASLLGYAGILTGPALIGWVAHGVGLPAALLCVAALLGVVAARSKKGLLF